MEVEVEEVASLLFEDEIPGKMMPLCVYGVGESFLWCISVGIFGIFVLPFTPVLSVWWWC